MTQDKCTVCGKDTNTQCSRCKAAYYCSIQCQEKDRELHRLLCSKYQEFLATRPIPKEDDKKKGDVLPVAYKAAILFPADFEIPQLIWLTVHTSSSFDPDHEKKEVAWYHYEEYVLADLGKFMGLPKGMAHKREGRELKVYMGDNAFALGPVTKSLLTLNAGYTNNDHNAISSAPWAGNLVVVNATTRKVRIRSLYESIEDSDDDRMDIDDQESDTDDLDSDSDDEDSESAEYFDREAHNDVSLTDLRYAFDYLTRENYIFESDKENKFVIRKPDRWFKAVKVHCDGARKFDGKPKYTEVIISRRHPMFMRPSGLSSISKHLGFPLLLKRLQPNPEWETKADKFRRDERRSFGEGENEATSCLMIDVEVTSRHWRWAPEIWDKGMDYTCLVARKDMKDLTAHQVQVLCSYCKLVVAERMSVITQMISDGNLDGDQSDIEKKLDDFDAHFPSPRTRRKLIKQYLLSDKFAKYFEKYKQKKFSKGDATWDNATLPLKGSVPDKIVETEEERYETFVREMDAAMNSR
jgi:MYND finger